MGKLLQMKPAANPVEFYYEPTDVELRGAEDLLRRAAYHLDTLYWKSRAWDTEAHCDAYCVLKLLYENAEKETELRKELAAYVAPELPEVVQ